MQIKHNFFFLFSLVFAFTACSPVTSLPLETESSEPATETAVPTAAPKETAAELPTAAPTEVEIVEPYPYPYPAPPQEIQPNPFEVGYPAPTDSPPPPIPAEPLPVTVTASDGVQLAGTYFAPLFDTAPVVVLFHQFGSNQHQWDDLVRWLQTGLPPAGVDWLPPLPIDLTFAVLTLDFRGHGESQGSMIIDSGLLLDAQAALSFVKTQPGVDPDRIITIGTSIGADAAVDACVTLESSIVAGVQEPQGCLGAMSLSPGSYIGVDYMNAAEALLEAPHFASIYCLAAEGDSPSPAACNAVSGKRYKAVIYPGSDHGVALLKPGLDPDVGPLILEFLIESLQLHK
jgi:dienelactone hydrolase